VSGTDDHRDLGTVGQEGGRIARAAGMMGVLTLASRILGLARDVGQAAVLGTGIAADAFTLAFVVPNILRRLFGESTVSAAFVPTYTTVMMREGRDEGSILGSRILTFCALCLVAACLAGMAASPLLVRLFAPGFAAVPGKTALAAGLMRLLFPYVLFVGLAAVVMGILNSSRHFLTPALAPVLFNVLALAGLFALPALGAGGDPVWAYSTGVLAGGVVQLLIQLPALGRTGFRFRPSLSLKDPAFRSVTRLAVPALVGLAVAEVNVLVDQMVASVLDEGSVAALSYGNRIMQFPLGVFAVALSTALLPTLSRQAALGRLAEARTTMGHALLGLAVLLVPATIFISADGEGIVRVLLARGVFDARSTDLTRSALVYYSAGLLFYGGVKVVAPVFYAMKDTSTPAKIAMACMGLNIPLNLLLSLLFIRTGWDRALGGVALATSLSSLVNFVLLMRAADRRLGRGGGVPRGAWPAVLLGGLAAAAAALLTREWTGEMCLRGLLPGAGALAASASAVYGAFLAVFLAAGGRGAASLVRYARRARG
jgi:putative peptidoglycan lipid II flippase